MSRVSTANETARRRAALELQADAISAANATAAQIVKTKTRTTRDRERDARFAAINTNLGSLLVQTFTTATAADQEYFLNVMGIAPADITTLN